MMIAGRDPPHDAVGVASVQRRERAVMPAHERFRQPVAVHIDEHWPGKTLHTFTDGDGRASELVARTEHEPKHAARCPTGPLALCIEPECSDTGSSSAGLGLRCGQHDPGQAGMGDLVAVHGVPDVKP